MKYIVKNKQLLTLMINHLDDFKANSDISKFDSYIILHGRNNDYYDHGGIDIEYDKEDGRLFIKKDVINNFMSWFPLDFEDSQEFIKDWFENKFDVKVKYFVS